MDKKERDKVYKTIFITVSKVLGNVYSVECKHLGASIKEFYPLDTPLEDAKSLTIGKLMERITPVHTIDLRG